MAARGSDLPGVTTAHMLDRRMDGYGSIFAGGRQPDGEVMPETVKLLMAQAASRSWQHLADERIDGIKPTIPLGKRFWPLTANERAGVDALFGTEDPHRLVTSLRSRDDSALIRVLDAAYWRKGCSSLGRMRLAVLVA
jgi:uncharacterized protein (DUF2252 family)